MSELPTYPIKLNAFEAGVLTVVLSEQGPRKQLMLKNVMEQLISLKQKFADEAGAETTDLGNNKILIKDKAGNTILRDRYPWEQ